MTTEISVIFVTIFYFLMDILPRRATRREFSKQFFRAEIFFTWWKNLLGCGKFQGAEKIFRLRRRRKFPPVLAEKKTLFVYHRKSFLCSLCIPLERWIHSFSPQMKCQISLVWIFALDFHFILILGGGVNPR